MPSQASESTLEAEEIIDCHNHVGVDPYFFLQGDHPYAQDLPSMVENSGALGITRWVAFPFVMNASFKVEPMREGRLERDKERIPYAFENRRLLKEIYEFFPEHAERVIPFVMLDPLRDTARQAKELRALRQEYKFYGLKIQATMIKARITALKEEGSVFLELAREWKLPFLIHSSVAENDPWSQASDILDIAEANPDIRFCLAHSCRFDRLELDRLAALPNAWFDCSAHGIHCQSVVRNLKNVATPERRLAGDYRDPAAILNLMYERYPEKLMWGSDSPFYTWIAGSGYLPFALKSTYQLETDYLMSQAEEVRRAIASVNTRKFIFDE